MLQDFFVERIPGGLELPTELLKKIFSGSFKVLKFLGFWVYRKMLLEFFAELTRGGRELLIEFLDLKKKNPFEIVWVCLKYCSFLEVVYRKILLHFFVEDIRGGRAELSTELSTELLD